MFQRRGGLWILVLALLVAPTLGFMHRVVHGPHVEAAHEHLAAQEHAAGCDHAHGWLTALFGHDEHDTGCRLYDQLGQGDSLPAVPALLLPLVLTSFLLRRSQGLALARWRAQFDARGPPSFR